MSVNKDNVTQKDCSEVDRLETEKKKPIPTEEFILAGVSKGLAFSAENASSTILPLTELKRRLSAMYAPIQTECSVTDTKRSFSQAEHSQQADGKVDISLLVEEPKYMASCTHFQETPSGNENVKSSDSGKEMFDRFPDEFMNSIQLNVNNEEGHQVEKRTSPLRLRSPSHPPPPKKRKTIQIRGRPIPPKKGKTSQRRGRPIKSRGPPIPQLGRPFQKRVIATPKLDPNFVTNTFKKLKGLHSQREKETDSTANTSENLFVEFTIATVIKEERLDFADNAEHSVLELSEMPLRERDFKNDFDPHLDDAVLKSLKPDCCCRY